MDYKTAKRIRELYGWFRITMLILAIMVMLTVFC